MASPTFGLVASWIVLLGFIIGTMSAKPPASGYGSDLKVDCAAGNEILGVPFTADNRLLATCAEPQICNKYFPVCKRGGSCGSPFSYVYNAREVDGEPYDPDNQRRKRGVHGRIVQKCCTLQKPEEEEVFEFCEIFTLSHSDTRKVDLFKSSGGGVGAFSVSRYVQYIAKVPQGYTFKICYLQCSDTTTTRRPTTEVEELPEDILGEDFFEQIANQQNPPGDAPPPIADIGAGEGGGHCFPEDVFVQTVNGHVRMDQLKVGDRVLTHADTFSGHTFEPIMFFLHREPETPASFLEFTTGTGIKVQMTERHLIPVVSCDTEELKLGNGYLASQMRPANQVKIGSCLLIHGQPTRVDPVLSIRQLTRRGIYNPVTSSGTIVANGVHCGVYLDGEEGALHYMAYAVMNFGKTILEIVGGLEQETKVELPWFISVALRATSSM